MIKHIINFTDYNGVEKREEHYFNLTQAEITKKEIKSKGGYSEYFIKVINTRDNMKLLELFDELIIEAYGIKTTDGRFVKSPEISQDFLSSAAYNELFVELFSDSSKLIDFVNSLFNSNMKVNEKRKDEINKMLESGMYPDEVLEKLKENEIQKESVDNIIPIS